MESIKRDVQIVRWKNLIQERIDSGLTIAQWCRENHFSENSYYYWLKVLRKEALAQRTVGAMMPKADQTQAFVEVPPQALPPAAREPGQPAAVLRRGDISIELYAGTPQPLIQALIGGLSHA